MASCTTIQDTNIRRILDSQGNVLCEYVFDEHLNDFSYISLSDPHTVVPINGTVLKYADVKNFINIIEKHNLVLQIKNYTPTQWDQILYDWSTSVTQDQGFYVESELDEYGEIVEVGTHHICFNVADYVATLFGSRYGSWNYIETSWNWLLNQTGVFKVEIENSYESHGFVVYISNGIIRIYQGYGGHVGIIYVEDNLEMWKTKLAELFNSKSYETQVALILQLFRFPEAIFFGDYTYPRTSDKLITFKPGVLFCRLC